MDKYYTPDEYQNKIRDFVCYRVPEIDNIKDLTKDVNIGYVSYKIPWCYSFYNIIAELEEFENTKYGSEAELLEAGDVLFSIADICNCFQMSFGEVVQIDIPITDLSINSPKYAGWSYRAILADMASKNIRDGKEIDRCLLFYTLHGIVDEMMYSINQNRLKNNHVDIAVILKMNIDKLQSRLERNVIKGDGDDR